MMLLLACALIRRFVLRPRRRRGGPGRCDEQEHQAAAASQGRRPVRARRFRAARPKRRPPAAARVRRPCQIIVPGCLRASVVSSSKNSSSSEVCTPLADAGVCGGQLADAARSVANILYMSRGRLTTTPDRKRRQSIGCWDETAAWLRDLPNLRAVIGTEQME